MKAIIFDFGNVVAFFDHHPAFKKLSPFTAMSPQAMYDAVYATPLEDQFERGLITTAEFLEQAQRIWQLRCEAEFIQRTLSDIFTANPEVCDLIPKLKGRYRIVLGSNTNPIHSQQFLAQFAEVLGHFDHVVLSHNIRTRKPDAEFFLHCQRAAAVPASECVFVDDLPDNIAGARAAGLQGIVYRPDEDLTGQLHELGVVV